MCELNPCKAGQIKRIVQDIEDRKFREMGLIKKYGFDLGQQIANILAAEELGLLPQKQMHMLIQRNIEFFYGIER